VKTIIIQIQVPDGVDVKVTQGGQSSKGGDDFVPRPDPDYPEVACGVCGSGEWRLIKAGYSKTKKNADGTAKRFNAFYVCGTDGCDGKPEQGDQLPF
jgi:hypothetical protein